MPRKDNGESKKASTKRATPKNTAVVTTTQKAKSKKKQQNKTGGAPSCAGNTTTKCKNDAGAFGPPYGIDGMCFPATGNRQLATARTLKQQLQDVSTGVLVKHMFRNVERLRYYVGAFAACFSRCVAEAVQARKLPSDAMERDCALVYKGGNVMADYFEQVLRLPGVNVHSSLTYLLSRSDTDFTIAMTMRMERYRSVISRASVKAIYMFRQWLQANARGYPMPTSDDYMQALHEYSAIAVKANYTVVCTEVTPRLDMLVMDTTKDIARGLLHAQHIQQLASAQCGMLVASSPSILDVNADRWTLNGPPLTPPSSMYASFNDTLMYELGDGARGHFDLARLKTNVKLHIRESNGRPACIDAPGELIDVSISYPDDNKKVMSQDVGSWTVVDTYGRVPVRIPTLHYIVYDDLFTILFKNSRYPWLDLKYEKRMARLLLGACMIAALGSNFQATRAGDISYHKGTAALTALQVGKLRLQLMCLRHKVMTGGNISECQQAARAFPELTMAFWDVAIRACTDPTQRKSCEQMFTFCNTFLSHLAVLFTSIERVALRISYA